MFKRDRRRRAVPRRRAGFTIVEVVVAVMILAVGVLGLAGAAAIVTRMMGSSEMRSDASNVAAARFESLRATRCPIASGSASSTGITEKWTATQLGSPAYRMYEVVDSVQYTIRDGQRSQTFRSIVQCQP